MRRNAKAVPFDGTPPPVKPGDPVRFRDANGRWFDGKATSEPRYAFEDSIGGQCFLAVAVTSPVLVRTYGRPVNWPAEDVRPTTPEVGTPDEQRKELTNDES